MKKIHVILLCLLSAFFFADCAMRPAEAEITEETAVFSSSDVGETVSAFDVAAEETDDSAEKTAAEKPQRKKTRQEKKEEKKQAKEQKEAQKEAQKNEQKNEQTNEPAKENNTPSPTQQPDITGRIIGTWECEEDMTSAINAELAAPELKDALVELGIDDFTAYMQLRPAIVKATYTLSADGRAAFDYDRACYEQMLRNCAEDIADAMIRALEDAIAIMCEEMGITPEGLYAEYGAEDIYGIFPVMMDMSIEEFKQMILDDVVPGLNEFLNDYPINGTYTANGYEVLLRYEIESKDDDHLIYNEGNDTLTLKREDDIIFTRKK